jgi:hypothetical protein
MTIQNLSLIHPGRLVKAALQGPVLDIKVSNIGFNSPCYTEAMKFYTEPDTIGYA